MTDVLERLRVSLADRYTIERELGAGGMATVYLARDRKLGRPVALKVLRPELAAALGPERFLREIEIAAKLNHPHILPVFDSGQAEVPTSRAADARTEPSGIGHRLSAIVLYYTMPFVEGESLRDRLTREKQLPLDDALRITREVADALGYAHARGLVHRDIKPENILFQAGHAVVADFGIAKAVSAAGGERLTETGLAIGTPAYMSPEQAAGSGDIDGRSDLYSLGCVLYEMLAGDPPFYASTPQAVLAKKLSEPTPRISVVREVVPPGLEAVLTKVLAKTPADRYATAVQFAAALAHPELVVVTPSGGLAPTAPVPIRGARTRRRIAVVLGGVAVLATVGAVVTLRLLPRSLNITVSDITQVTNAPGVEGAPAVSPDGNEVAYVRVDSNTAHVFTRPAVHFTTSAAVRLGDTASSSEWFPSWTPDGQRVRFLGCVGGLGQDCAYRDVSKMGGAEQALSLQAATAHCTACTPTWSADGTRLVFTRRDTIFVSGVGDTVPHPIAVDTIWRHGAPHSFAWSPDGRRIAYVLGNSQTGLLVGASSIWVVSAVGGTPQPITTDGHLNTSPAWLDERHLLFVSDRDGGRAVYAVAVGPHGRRGEGRIVPGMADPDWISYSVASHRVAWSKSVNRQNVRVYPLAPSAPVSIRNGRAVTTGEQVIEAQDVSWDGRWIAYSAQLAGRPHLFKVPVGGGQPVPLWSGPGEERPAWSPDGREIAFVARGGMGQPSRLGVMPAGGGAPALITSGPGDDTSPRWSPDGLHILFRSSRSGTTRWWTLSRDSVGSPWHGASQLPDSIVYCTDWAPDGSGPLCEDARGTVMIVNPRGDRVLRRDVFTLSEWSQYDTERFSRDGRTLYVAGARRDVRGPRYGIWAVPLAGGPPRLVVAFDDPFNPPNRWLSVGPDALYLTVTEKESDIWVAKLNY